MEYPEMETIENFRGGVSRPRSFPNRSTPTALEIVLARLAWLSERLGRAAARRRTIRMLHALDDHTLNDIGLKRAEIDTLVLSPPRRRGR
jgi:uncharacterized protein YjiS (DUF1127 family)